MTSSLSNDQPSISSVLWMGALRSIIVNSVTYPLEVIKTNQQVNPSPAYKVVINLIKEGGATSFYRGFVPHLIKAGIKQTVWWPAITYIPPALEKRDISGIKQHLITGFSIATLDALANSPLEKWRVLSSIGAKNPLQSLEILSEGWSGFFPYWRRQGITWSLFLLGQHHFTKPYKKEEKSRPLSLYQVLETSFKLSLIANLIITPFDTLNTIRQSRSKLDFKVLEKKTANSQKNVRLLYRGLPLNFLSMMIQVTATIFLMDKIQTQQSTPTLKHVDTDIDYES